MKDMYRIHWKSIKNGKEGQGTGLFPKEEAECYCAAMNKEDKGLLIHWIVKEIEKEEIPCAPPA